MGAALGALSLPRLIAAGGALAAAPAWAHHPAGVAGAELAWRWNADPWLMALLFASALLYALGVRRLWARAGMGRGIAIAEVARFAAGWLLLVAALLSPIDSLGGALFSAHMVQHELLMVGAAPLLVLGRPLEAWAWGLPFDARRALGGVARIGWLRATWGFITEPVGAWAFHAIALWAWHVPALFEAALQDETLHAFQHASFLGSALAFWWAVFGGAARRRDAGSLASLFTTMLHTGALGALLTFAPTPWYAHYESAAAFGLAAIEDQQLGGLVMWMPGSLSYLVAALAIVAAWLSRPSAQVR